MSSEVPSPEPKSATFNPVAAVPFVPLAESKSCPDHFISSAHTSPIPPGDLANCISWPVTATRTL